MIFGCTVCAFQITGTVIPGVGWWYVGLPVWLFLLATVSARAERPLPCTPTRSTALILILTAVATGLGILGPLPLLGLGVIILISISVSSYHALRGRPADGSRAAFLVSAVMLSILLAISGASWLRYRSLSPAQRVIGRHGIAASIELRKLGPLSVELLPIYREILEGDASPAMGDTVFRTIARSEDRTVAAAMLSGLRDALESRPDGHLSEAARAFLREAAGHACREDHPQPCGPARTGAR